MIPVTICLNDLNGKGNYEEVDLSEDTLKKILVDFDMYIVQPIIINEEFEIIEGQCRFQQLKQLNKNYATVQLHFQWKEKLISLLKTFGGNKGNNAMIFYKGFPISGGITKTDLLTLKLLDHDD